MKATLTTSLISLFLPACALAQVPVSLIALEGTVPTGSGGLAITSLNTPYTNSVGDVGFTGQLTGSVGFVFINNQVVFKNTDVNPPVLTGAEGTMGISNSGDFIYSPSANGNDSVYRGTVGVLLQDGDASPGFPGLFNTFNSRPTMTPNGTAYWVAGISTTSGGTTIQRVVYSATGGTGTITPVIAGGDAIQGNATTAAGLNFTYDFSENNNHHIHHVVFTGSTATDNAIVVGTPGNLASYSILMREGSPTGQGGNWQNFRSVNVNNQGDTIVIGDDNTTVDDFLAFNGSIVMRQGQVFDSITLGTTVDASALNNVGQFLALWDVAGGGEALFLGNVSDFANAQVLLQTGDQLDTNGDNVADFTLTDFLAAAGTTNVLDFSDHGTLFLEVSLTPIAGGTALDAIIGISVASVPEPGTLVLAGAGVAGWFGWRYLRNRRLQKNSRMV